MCDRDAYFLGSSNLYLLTVHIFILPVTNPDVTRGFPEYCPLMSRVSCFLPVQRNALLNLHTHMRERRIFRMLRFNTLLIESSLILLFTPVVATGCHMPNGSASIDEQWPCNPSAEASICCGVLDYCLGSVMCIDAGADNQFSIQGCTDVSWPGACNPICPGTSPSLVHTNYRAPRLPSTWWLQER